MSITFLFLSKNIIAFTGTSVEKIEKRVQRLTDCGWVAQVD
jgi:hypothetical protein